MSLLTPKTILPHSNELWISLLQRPEANNLYWILYERSQQVRLAYWQNHGSWGSGFYCVTEILTPEPGSTKAVADMIDRQSFRPEPAMYVWPDKYQPVKGMHQIITSDKL